MNRSWSFWVILGLALPLAAACGTSSSTKNNTPPATSGGSLPAYTLVSESPVDCATENTDGSVTADINCHVHVVFNDAVTTTKVRMNITGTFQASEVYPLLFGSNSAASDGWVLEFFRSGAAPNGMLYMYVTPGESASPQDFHTFSNIFNQGDAFSLTVEADRGSSPDTILAWADTTPTATPAGDYNSGTSTGVPGVSSNMTGNKVGVSLRGATLNTATITASGGTFTPAIAGVCAGYTLVAADGVGDIYSLDESTAAATLLLNTTLASADLGLVSSMVYDSSAGLLAGRAGHSSFSACVASINPGTGVATTLDSTACPVNALTDMTNNGGTIIANAGSGTTLYTISASTGAPTAITHTFTGATGGGGGLTIGNDGYVYAAYDGDNSTGAKLYSSDLATLSGGTGTTLGQFSTIGFTAATYLSVLSMTTCPVDGTIYAIARAGGSSAPHHLVTVQPTNPPSLTNIGMLSAYHDGLAYIPDTLIPPP